ncbi:hypothetical protein EPL05_04490 [Mucilaginibacter gilvus]|uniref:Uncharacterized protein n=2 Tax=Mucilaginibacter gilvus TaxID=2305909 RepID=A0A3S3V570_9SPHI|nr:hypothetical protein EPL05_04490 [Mucilaginibacter gilvus]
MFAAAMFAASSTFAQTHKDTTVTQKVGTTVKKGWKATKKTASKVGNETAEVTSKGAAAVLDKKYDGMVGPHGQTIYIDKNAHYYYVNYKGRHIYVRKSALVAKP